MTIDVSLLVCTRDRATRLDGMLASIAAAVAAADGVTVEVVLVDNGSRDATLARLAAWCAVQPCPTCLVVEPAPGLARARNAGLRRIRGRIVAMTDDDCVLHTDYLAALVRAFAQRPGPAIIGGRILLGDPADLLVTVKLEDHPMVAPDAHFPGGFVMGANLAFTADILAVVGDFDERLGSGAPFRAAEDTDFLLRAQRAGVVVSYDPGFVVDHHHGRRQQRQIRRLMAGYAFGDGAVYAKHLLADRRIVRSLLADLRDVGRDFGPAKNATPPIRCFFTFRLVFRLLGFGLFMLISARQALMEKCRSLGTRTIGDVTQGKT